MIEAPQAQLAHIKKIIIGRKIEYSTIVLQWFDRKLLESSFFRAMEIMLLCNLLQGDFWHLYFFRSADLDDTITHVVKSFRNY